MNQAFPIDYDYEPPGEPFQPPKPGKAIRAKPFVWIDPSVIPPRDWIYGGHFIRKFVSTTVAPGGVGKSSFEIVEMLAMTSGKPLLGIMPSERFRVWMWNGEDPEDELQRRIMAAAVQHGLAASDFEGRLFVDSGRDMEMVIAEQTRDGAQVVAPVIDAIKATILANKIDVVIIDPFVSSHRVTENDNGAIDRVAKAWAKIADDTGCAVELVHHVRKTNNAEVTVEDGRGAVALLSAARSARVLNVMTEDEGARAGVEHRRLHFRVDNGKSNLAPPPEKSDWYKLANVELGNGDKVGVVTEWTWPNALDQVTVADLRAVQKIVEGGRWRENTQAKEWVGYAVAQALKLDVARKADKAKITGLLKIWRSSGALVAVEGKDVKGMVRTFIEVGTHADD
jgi:hypothetical protein